MRTPRHTLAALAAASTLIAALSAQEPALDPAEQALSALVSLELRHTPLGRALGELQKEAGVNILYTGGLQDHAVSLLADQQPLAGVLQAILEPMGLGYTTDDGVILVDDALELLSRRAVFRAYDVRDLLSPVEDFPGPVLSPIDTPGDTGGYGITMGIESGVEMLDPDMLVDLVTLQIEPDSWDAPRVAISVSAGFMTVVNSPEVQDQVAELLAKLRAAESFLVAVDARAYTLPLDRWKEIAPAARRTGPVFLSAQQRQQLDEQATLRGLATTVGYNSQRVSAFSLQIRPYVRDYDVEVAQSSVAMDPIVLTFLEGLALDVRPVVSGDTRAVTLELRVEAKRQTGSMRRAVVPDGSAVDTTGESGGARAAEVGLGCEMQLPDSDRHWIRTHVRVPLGQGAAFASSGAPAPPDHILLLVVTPRLVE